MTKTGTPETVCLDVGGTKYKISKALIEQHPSTMLARLVSDTWKKGDDADIFIDRDGELFRHVLAYMRDLKVYLPMEKVSKKTVLQELAYFGFESVPEDAIDGGCSRIAAASTVVLNRAKHYERVERFTWTIHYEIVAYECYRYYIESGNFNLKLYKDNSYHNYRNAPKIPSWNQQVLDKCLLEYGLKSVETKYSLNNWVDLTFAIA